MKSILCSWAPHLKRFPIMHSALNSFSKTFCQKKASKNTLTGHIKKNNESQRVFNTDLENTYFKYKQQKFKL